MTPFQTIFRPMAGAAKKVAYSDTAGSTAAMDATANAVWVVTTTDAFVRVGGTAVVDTDMYVPAFVPVLLALGAEGSSDGDQIISAVRVTADGTLYACPVK